MITLPPHLRTLGRVVADEAVRHERLTERVARRVGHLPWQWRAEDEPPPTDEGPGHTLHLKRYRGSVARHCPGTRRYHCCGYRVLHVGENCPLSCTYCILHAYFQHRVLTVWANQVEVHAAVDAAYADSRRRIRVGTGEFTDSLALEAVTGLARDLVAHLAGRDHVCLELKSKVVDLSWMDAATRPDRVLPAWSVNAPSIVAAHEMGASSLEERLAAARTCADAGFRVCLHFDPIIHFPGWEAEYASTVAMIAATLRPEEVAYISLGSFRFLPDLKAVIERERPDAAFVYNEFVTGRDGKQRLLRPLRVEQFRAVAGALTRAGFGDALYFCMESEAVWRAVLGRTPAELPGGGLRHFLEHRAFGGPA